MPSLRPVFRFLCTQFKQNYPESTTANSIGPPIMIPRPRMGSVEYWTRFQFQTMSSSRRPSALPEGDIEEQRPRMPSMAEGIPEARENSDAKPPAEQSRSAGPSS